MVHRKGHPAKRLMTLTTAAGLLALTAGPAAAQSCGVMVERFAAANGLSTTPPPTAPRSALNGLPPGAAGSTGRSTDGSPGGSMGGSMGGVGQGEALGSGASGGVTTDRLARSGGVVAPPPIGTGTPVIQPPDPGPNSMATAPPIAPDAGTTGEAPAGGTMGRAARDAQMESLVTAAREAAKDGDDQRCMDSLAQARDLARAAAGGGTGEGGGR